MTPKLYLAGPDVFLPEPDKQAALKATICRACNIEPLHPLDNDLSMSSFSTKRDMAEAIMRANCEMMRRADGCIANLTPFHGPSADVGTAFEVGFMHALGKPVFGYSNVTSELITRVDDWIEFSDDDSRVAHSLVEDMTSEDFDQFDNLMLPFALEFFSATETRLNERYLDLLTFTRVAHHAAAFNYRTAS